jgi:hypothetical protein
MERRTLLFLLLILLAGVRAGAQKPFTEGTIVYNVQLESAEHKELKGVYTFMIKGGEIKKELKLNNGYEDIVLINTNTSTAHSLQSKYGKKYAIELKMADLTKLQDRFIGFTLNNEQPDNKKIAGQPATKGVVTYKDGSKVDILFSKELYPVQAITYERFPGTKFLPLSFSYKDEHGMILHFEAEKIEPGPVDNATFRIPGDYKMISYKEYKELSQ